MTSMANNIWFFFAKTQQEAANNSVLLEIGDPLLLESGDTLTLE